MSDFSRIFVLRIKKQQKIAIDMAKVQIKSKKLTSFGGISPKMEKFNSMLAPVIDSTPGLRCKPQNCFRLGLDKTSYFAVMKRVLPQAALWGKGGRLVGDLRYALSNRVTISVARLVFSQCELMLRI